MDTKRAESMWSDTTEDMDEIDRDYAVHSTLEPEVFCEKYMDEIRDMLFLLLNKNDYLDELFKLYCQTIPETKLSYNVITYMKIVAEDGWDKSKAEMYLSALYDGAHIVFAEVGKHLCGLLKEDESQVGTRFEELCTKLAYGQSIVVDVEETDELMKDFYSVIYSCKIKEMQNKEDKFLFQSLYSSMSRRYIVSLYTVKSKQIRKIVVTRLE